MRGNIGNFVERSGVAAELVGARILSQEIRPLILRDGLTASLIAGAGMFLFLLFAFRRLVLVALTALPLVAGMATAVGLMALVNAARPHLVAAAPHVAAALGFSVAAGAKLAELAGGLQLEFNLVTIAMLPLVFGIAIDNGIHVVHRRQEGVDQDVADVLRHVGRGVLMASLTTIVGFGALLSALRRAAAQRSSRRLRRIRPRAPPMPSALALSRPALPCGRPERSARWHQPTTHAGAHAGSHCRGRQTLPGLRVLR